MKPQTRRNLLIGTIIVLVFLIANGIMWISDRTSTTYVIINLVLIVIIGLSFAGWLLWKESKKKEKSITSDKLEVLQEEVMQRLSKYGIRENRILETNIIPQLKRRGQSRFLIWEFTDRYLLDKYYCIVDIDEPIMFNILKNKTIQEAYAEMDLLQRGKLEVTKNIVRHIGEDGKIIENVIETPIFPPLEKEEDELKS